MTWEPPVGGADGCGVPGLVAAAPQDLGDSGGGQGRSPGPESEAVQAGQLVACARPEYRVRALPVFTPKGTWRHLAHLVWLWLTVIPHR